MKPDAHSIRVVTVEDHDAFREHLAALIGGAGGFSCVGSHRTAEAALEHLPAERPDVLLLDLELPNAPGNQLIAEVVRRWPTLPVLILTVHDDSERLFRAMEAGAIGYLVKPVSPGRLLEAIAEAHGGGSPMSSQIARLVVRKFQEQNQSRRNQDGLTSRETEILTHVSRGLYTKEIADRLQVSERTVGTHLRNIYEKLQVHSRSAAVARFLGRE